jgi:hypothetical protein
MHKVMWRSRSCQLRSWQDHRPTSCLPSSRQVSIGQRMPLIRIKVILGMSSGALLGCVLSSPVVIWRLNTKQTSRPGRPSRTAKTRNTAQCSLANRFLSPDSIMPDSSNPPSLSRYSYGYNRPLVAISTSGHLAWFVTALVGAAAGAIVLYGAQVVANVAESGQLFVVPCRAWRLPSILRWAQSQVSHHLWAITRLTAVTVCGTLCRKPEAGHSHSAPERGGSDVRTISQ